MATLIVDGQEYDFDFDFSVGEARTLHRMSGVTLDKLGENKTNPDVVAAIILIAFQRKSPDASVAELEKRADRVKLAALDFRDEDEVVLPPGSTRTVQNGSASTSGETSSSGAETSPASETPEVTGHPA